MTTSSPDVAVREALDALRSANLAHMRAAGLAPPRNAAGNTAGLSIKRARPLPSVPEPESPR